MVSGNTPLSVEASGLRALFDRLVTYKVLRWAGTSNDPDMASDRVVMNTEDSDVVSSSILALGFSTGRHKVVLDIDHPTYLVKSTTPGHYHLYIDVPGGIKWPTYERLLQALKHAGVIEKGYCDASIKRGATMVRLPWVKKDPNTGGDSR